MVVAGSGASRVGGGSILGSRGVPAAFGDLCSKDFRCATGAGETTRKKIVVHKLRSFPTRVAGPRTSRPNSVTRCGCTAANNLPTPPSGPDLRTSDRPGRSFDQHGVQSLLLDQEFAQGAHGCIVRQFMSGHDGEKSIAARSRRVALR